MADAIVWTSSRSLDKERLNLATRRSIQRGQHSTWSRNKHFNLAAAAIWRQPQDQLKGTTLGEIFPPKKVVLIVAISTRHEPALTWAQDALEAEYGDLLLTSDAFDFDQTTYYTESMGEDLKKQFVAHSTLMDPAALPDVKRRTNELEDLYREENDYPETRPLNLDPGYISEGKLILASTKNHSHRIYLRDGIFAEITLHYHKKAWQPREWTYPDYKQPEFHAVFNQCRQYLRQQLVAQPRTGRS